MIGQRSTEQNSKFAQRMEKLRDENRDLQRKLDDSRRDIRQDRNSETASAIKSALREKQKYQDLSEDLKFELSKVKKQLNDREKSRGDDFSRSDSSRATEKLLEKENKDLRQELRLLQQESRQYRQRSYSRSRYGAFIRISTKQRRQNEYKFKS